MNQLLPSGPQPGRYPFIVVEGIDGVGKSTISKALAWRLNAPLLSSPGPFGDISLPQLGPLRAYFDAQPPALRRSFYRAANTLVGHQADALTHICPVVCDRYWPSTYAYSVGLDEALDDLPSPGRYPSGLRRPDFVVLVTAAEEERRQRQLRRDGGHGTREEKRLSADVATATSIVEALRAFATLEIENVTGASEAAIDVIVERIAWARTEPA